MIKHKHIILSFGFLALLAPLYWAKAEADKMRDHMHDLEDEIKKEQKTLRSMEAELAFLSRFDRLDASARKDLGLEPIKPEQLASLNNLDAIAPFPAPKPIDAALIEAEEAPEAKKEETIKAKAHE